MPQKISNLLQIGQDALASGQVTPEEVEAAKAQLNKPETADWLSSFLAPKDPLGPMSVPRPSLELPKAPKVSTGVGKQLSQKTDMKTEGKKSRTENLYASGDEFLDLTDRIRNLPEYQEQSQGIKGMEDVLNMMKGVKSNNQDWLVAPLLSLADAQTGSNLRAGFTPTAGRNEKLLAYADDIQKRKADLSKGILEGVSKLKTGSESNAVTQQLMQALGYTQGMLASGANQGMTVGESAVDKAYAKDYTNFILEGGYSTAVANLDKMSTIVDRLNTEKDLTGGTVGAIPKIARDYTHPESANLQDEYEQIVQQNLKAVLGAQFTEAEAKKLIERSFNPRLDQKYNAKRILEVQAQMAEALRAKKQAADYFEKNRYSMRGYSGATRVKIGDKTYDVAKDFSGPGGKEGGGAPAGGGGKIKVKNPAGKVGMIPQSQLADALAQGYTEVK